MASMPSTGQMSTTAVPRHTTSPSVRVSSVSLGRGRRRRRGGEGGEEKEEKEGRKSGARGEEKGRR